ncbi:hypothetical protein LTR70_003047 [Exophiala xenobiotica]|uniref:NADPH oxidase regulator NoxR n=1 Tax=Lithohypha guttulata TaxID=1690604 RepID=A0ABR0K857_9EURO|nr:hypothetical protein LTR24_005727 [Lithohypha guttulata]KAK5324417.1 hypothetical protein LTR70_003047 [Exophiala xenobiotica]
MSLKQEIETWVEALSYYDSNQFENSLKIFDNIADTSKILFNCGVIHATIGEHDRAVECYQRATQLDQYLAVAYFQEGVSNFLVGDFEEALANFNDTLLYLRGNTYIDYEQLGLKFKLYSCEVLFNRGLCYIYLQQEKPGMQDFQYAVKEKMTPDHDVIDDAISERAVGYTVFSIPVGVLYRPNEAKVKNLKTKDYLGKARLIATATSNTSTGFAGAEQRERQLIESSAKDDRLPENISYAATNLVDRTLTRRGGGGREQSAPPTMGRNQFPPTPPPEGDKARSSISNGAQYPSRNMSLRNANHRPAASFSQQDPRPQPLTIRTNPQAFETTPPLSDRGSSTSDERQRVGTTRTASEPRGPQSRQKVMERNASQQNSRPSGPLYGETTRQHLAYMPEEDTVDDVYGMYNTSAPRPKKKHRSKQHQEYLDEEDEYINSSPDENTLRVKRRSHSRGPSVSSTSSSKRPEMRKIRVKVHANDDTRYIMLNTPSIEYDDFESRVREKFGIRGKMRMLMRDFDDEPGQMITMADQDDLDVLLNHVKFTARKERNEMGKMEVWVQQMM